MATVATTGCMKTTSSGALSSLELETSRFVVYYDINFVLLLNYWLLDFVTYLCQEAACAVAARSKRPYLSEWTIVEIDNVFKTVYDGCIFCYQ